MFDVAILKVNADEIEFEAKNQGVIASLFHMLDTFSAKY